jgi:hypothetical protein
MAQSLNFHKSKAPRRIGTLIGGGRQGKADEKRRKEYL